MPYFPIQRLFFFMSRFNLYHYPKSECETCGVCLFGLLVGCLTSQQHASISQGRICSDNFTCCHTEIEVADQTVYLTPVTVYCHRADQSQRRPYNARRLGEAEQSHTHKSSTVAPSVQAGERGEGGDWCSLVCKAPSST